MKLTPILDMNTYRKFVEVRDSYIFPAQEVPKIDFLIKGLLYCPCGYKMGIRISKSSRDQWNGEWEVGRISGHYNCLCKHEELLSPDCPRTVKNTEADRNVWKQVCNAINHPELLLEQAKLLVDELKTDALISGNDKGLIEKELDNLILGRQWVITQARKRVISESDMDQQLMDMSIREVELKKQLNAIQEAVMTERQWVITQARKGAFTTNDMEYHLSQLTFQEVTLKQELSTLGETININALNNWEENVVEFLADLRAGVEELRIVAPQTPEEQHEIFVLKKRVIDTLVERVDIDIDRNLFVQIRLNLLDILRKDAESGGSTAGVQNFEVETCTRKHDICPAGQIRLRL